MSTYKVYIYNDKEYFSLFSLRKNLTNVIFPNDPSNEVLEVLGVKVEEREYPSKTEEEIKQEELNNALEQRSKAVANITVEVDGMVFDGDEVSQERMARAILVAKATGEEDTATTTWVLHDNTVAQPTIAQLVKALRLAGEEQTKLWTSPYNN